METRSSDHVPQEGGHFEKKSEETADCSEAKVQGQVVNGHAATQNDDDSNDVRNSSSAMDADGEMAAGASANSKKRKKVRASTCRQVIPGKSLNNQKVIEVKTKNRGGRQE